MRHGRAAAVAPYAAVARLVGRQRLFRPGEPVVAAVSGGADSVFLLLSLAGPAQRASIPLHVAHIQHGWRPADAAEEATFVASLARRLGLPFWQRSVDAPALAGATHSGPERAARELRYAALWEICLAAGARTLATGHTADDQLETVLLAWLRGSGLPGLAGMPASGPIPTPGAAGGRLVRPLLSLERAALRSALLAGGESWRDDPTNLDRRLLRNRVRLELIPLLESLAPGARQTALRTAELARSAADAVTWAAARAAAELLRTSAPGTATLPRRAVLALPEALQAELLRQAVQLVQGTAADLEWAHVAGALAMVRRGRGGAVAWLSRRTRVRLARGCMIVERVDHPEAIHGPGRAAGDARHHEPDGDTGRRPAAADHMASEWLQASQSGKVY